MSYFTAAIDELAYRYQKLFTVATGNDGQAAFPDNRIQAPSDGMNALSVGAFEYSPTGVQLVSSYSSIGPGREAAKIKSEIVDLGGARDEPLILVGAEFFATDPVYGTSFAAPLVATKMAETIAASPDITPLVAKGLAIHKASPMDPKIGITKAAGFGFMPETSQNLYYDSDDEVTIIYHDNIDMKGVSRFLVPIPMNQDFSATKYDLTWTIVTMTAPNPSSSDAYSDFSIKDTLIIDDENVPKDKPRKTRSNKKYLPEQDLRNSDFKWDTVVKNKVTVKSATLTTPFVEISGLSRTTQSIQHIDFAIIITIKAYQIEWV